MKMRKTYLVQMAQGLCQGIYGVLRADTMYLSVHLESAYCERDSRFLRGATDIALSDERLV